MNPAIVVPAYNRPAALARLLGSLERAEYPHDGICLHISIDRGSGPDHQAVRELARSFSWSHGKKVVEAQPEHLGLVRQFLHCGNLAEQYGAVILLEDDLLVSPVFYFYAAAALDRYTTDARVAGVSLYGLWFNGYTHYPFTPLLEDSDIFFLQIPYTQGQAFTANQWRSFKNWYDSTSNPHPTASDPIHEMFLHFDAEDWFPIRTKYLIDCGIYYVYPRLSLATGFGDAGTHFSSASRYFQVPLQRFQTSYRFQDFDQAYAIYDSFYEILPDRLNRLAPALQGYRYTVDLNGTKSRANLAKAPDDTHILTSRRCHSPVYTFGNGMWPLEANVIESVPGGEIALCRKADLDWSWRARLDLKLSLHEHFTRGRRASRRQTFELAVGHFFRKLARGV